MVSKNFFLANILLLVFLFLFNICLYSQEKQKLEVKEPWTKRLFFGGNLGLQFGTITLIDISPHAGYWITDDLAGGIGFTYQYYKDTRYKPDYSTNIYGARIFGRYYIFENFFAHAEYEWLNYEAFSLFEDDSRVDVFNVLLGGGYRQYVSRRSFISIVILWNVNESVYSLYNNPVIRIGMNFGL